MPVKACYLVPTVGVSSAAEWEKKEWETTETSFSIQKGHENLYKYHKGLVIQSSRCKKGH